MTVRSPLEYRRRVVPPIGPVVVKVKAQGKAVGQPARRPGGSSGAPYPASLPGLLGWYDFSDSATLTMASTKISAVADKSGSGRTLSQATDAARFTTGTHNGLPCAVAAGAQSMNFAANPAINGAGFYAFAVFSTNAASILLDGNGVGNNPYLFYDAGDASAYCTFPEGNVLNGAVSGLWDATPDLHSAYGDTSGFTYSVNAGTVTSGAKTGFTINIFGGRSTLQINGKVCEVALGNAVLTAKQVADMQAYLKAKWATP